MNFPSFKEYFTMKVSVMLKLPSAFIPVGMSIAALALALFSVAIFGATREADEGAAAHLWQLLIAGQLPVMGFFALKWFPRTPRPAIPVMALQAVAFLAAVAPVYFLDL
jgi:hypothetical protein